MNGLKNPIKIIKIRTQQMMNRVINIVLLLSTIILCSSGSTVNCDVDSGYFLLNQVPIEYTCDCDDKFGEKSDPFKYVIAKPTEVGLMFSFKKNEEKIIDSFNFYLADNILRSKESNGDYDVFYFDSAAIKKPYSYTGSKYQIGDRIELHSIEDLSSLGRVYTFMTESTIGSSISRYYYEFRWSIRYGLLAFGYYDSRNKYFCKIKILQELIYR